MRVLVDLVRGLMVLALLLLLLFCSFAVNPGMFGWFSRDYARIADAYGPERAKLLDKRLEFDSDLRDRRRDLADIEQKLTLTRAKLGSGKDAELQADIDQLLDLKATEEQQVAELQKSVATTDKDIADIDRVVDRVQNSAETVYLAVRCVALGALGAVVQTLVAFLSRRRMALLFRHGNIERAFAAMMIGALAVVAAFAAFHTREVTIFNTVAAAPDLHPDFWRVTVLGLAVGALASWIFQAVTVGDRRFAVPGGATRPGEPAPAMPAAPVAAPVPPPAPAPAAPPPLVAAPAPVPAAAAAALPRPAAAPAPGAVKPSPTAPPPAATATPPAPAPPAAATPASAPAEAAPAPAETKPGGAAAVATPPAQTAAASPLPAAEAATPQPAAAAPPTPAPAPAKQGGADAALAPAAKPPIAPPATASAPSAAAPSPPPLPARPPLPPIPEAPAAKPDLPPTPAAAGRWPPVAPAAAPGRPAAGAPPTGAAAGAKWPPPLPGTGGAAVPPAKRPA